MVRKIFTLILVVSLLAGTMVYTPGLAADSSEAALGKVTSAVITFEENPDYDIPAVYSSFYMSEAKRISGTPTYYLSNGDSYKASADNGLWMVKDGYDIVGNYPASDPQAMHEKKAYFSDSDGNGTLDSYANAKAAISLGKATYYKPDLHPHVVRNKGIEGWFGFDRGPSNIRFYDDNYMGERLEAETEDLTVVIQDGDHVLKLAPYGYVRTSNTYKAPYTSVFGKNDIDILDKLTVMEVDVKVAKDAGKINLLLANQNNYVDGTLRTIEDGIAWNVMPDQYVVQPYSAFMQRKIFPTWYDAVTFEGGKIYLGKSSTEALGSYALNRWYKVKYYLDLTDRKNPKNTLVVYNSKGDMIVHKTSEIKGFDATDIAGLNFKTLNEKFALNKQVNEFTIDDKSMYAMAVSATAPEDGTAAIAYIDDFSFAKAEQIVDDATSGVEIKEEDVFETVEKNLTIEPDSVIREDIHPQMFGYNSEYSGPGTNGYELATGSNFLMDRYYQPNKKAAESLKGYPFEHVRYGGGSYAAARWKEQFGPLWMKDITDGDDNRYVGFGRNKSAKGDRFTVRSDGVFNIEKKGNGVVENINVMLMFNPDITITYCLNVTTDTIENQIDLVEFLTSDGTINYNGGENWGKIRRETYGIDKLNIFAWELGNEVDLNNANIDEYIELIKKYVPAIRTVDKKTPIAVHIASNDTSSVGQEWQRRLLIECGDLIDNIVIHKYIGFNSVTAVAESTVRKVINDIEEFGDPNRHKILFTEYNTSWISDRADWKKNTSISSAVTIADYMIRMLHYPQVIEADFHAINGSGAQLRTNGTNRDPLGYVSSGGPWWAYYIDRDKVVKPVASLDVLKVFCENSKDAQVVTAKLDDFELGRGSMATTVAFKQSNGDICVFLTNFEEFKNLQVNIQNDGYYMKEDVRIYGTNGKYSMNHFDVKEVNVDRKTYNEKNECKQYTIAPMSFAMVRLSPIK